MKNLFFNLKTPLYKRLNATKSPNTKIIENHTDFMDFLEKISQTKNLPIFLSIGGGGLFGIASAKILQKFKKEKIFPEKIIGNSIGSILWLLYYEKNFEKFFDFFLDIREWNYKNFTKREELIVKLIPFCLHFNENQKYFLIKNFENFREFLFQNENKKILKNITNESFEQSLQNCVKKFLKNHNISIENGTGRKLTFLNFEEKYQKKFWVYASKLGKKLIEKHIFEKNFPILDAILASTAYNRIEKIQWQNTKMYATDGYYSGNQPFFRENKKGIYIHIQTDDNWWLTRFLTDNYDEKLDFVIRPNLTDGESSNNLNRENILKIQEKAEKLING